MQCYTFLNPQMHCKLIYLEQEPDMDFRRVVSIFSSTKKSSSLVYTLAVYPYHKPRKVKVVRMVSSNEVYLTFLPIRHPHDG